MKKNFIIVILNVIIVLIIILSAFSYVKLESKNRIKESKEEFKSLTYSNALIATNYLEGEKNLCKSWSNYLKENILTMNDALSFTSTAAIDKEIMTHIIDVSSRIGKSTKPNSNNSYDVDYSTGELKELFLRAKKNDVTISRIFKNPINNKPSIGFYTIVEIKDEIDPSIMHDVLLIRIVPSSYLTDKWVFSTEKFENARVAIINPSNGYYIINSNSSEDSSFFDFYNRNNKTLSDDEKIELLNKLSNDRIILELKDNNNIDSLISNSQMNVSDNWVLLTLIPKSDLENINLDWSLLIFVSVGLFVLFIVDLVVLTIFNRKLKESAEIAYKANKAKTDFLSTMSHDIRTPMNAITGLTTIAQKNIDDRQIITDSLKKIDLSSRHLLTLINDILDISKVESGKLTLNPHVFSIVETTESLVGLSQPMVREKNINFNFRIHNFDIEYLYADQLRLNQIYINLLSNAIKYTDPNGTVNVDLYEEKSNKDDHVIIKFIIEDSGIGMSEEFMKTMYEPFQRQTDSRVNSIQGTGLGLTITKKMIELMNGSIECESKENVGTKFTVILDLPISNRQPKEMKLPNLKTLIVDDDPILLDTAVDTLIDLGLIADSATSGYEAFNKISAKHNNDKYDIVILDYKMPDIDGLEVAKKIREEIDKKIPIIIVSSYDLSIIEKNALEYGVNGFIYKPLFKSRLYEIISELLNIEEKESLLADNYSNLSGMNVLVAEDNDINYEIISKLLEMNNINTERAHNGLEAYDLVKDLTNAKYDLIFMDIQMPILNGIDATKKIRALDNEISKNIPIIAMTADAFSENISECLNAGMNSHIAKPIDMKLVLRELRNVKDGKYDK